MVKNIQSIRGMNDVHPKKTPLWQRIEETIKKVLYSYGYNEVRFPIVEKTSLFQRAMGEVTDVVEKEMYTFQNHRNGESLSLRPEGTACCVRAGIEHSFLSNTEQRLWYIGPMFRYERPQKGRYRQFHQIGGEVFGLQCPYIDAEIILLTTRLWKKLSISEYVRIEMNSIGSFSARSRYRDSLVSFLKKYVFMLDKNDKRRMNSNPLRIFDTKNINIKKILNDAPHLSYYLDQESKAHFATICEILSHAGISYTVNERLVRGLDYYNRTVFEWITTYLGRKCTVCAGGRYDGLVKKLGGSTTPAIGFAMGLERLVLLVQDIKKNDKTHYPVDVYVISSSTGVSTQSAAIRLSEKVRDQAPKLKLRTNYSIGTLKKKMNRADKLGAKFALILGDTEMESKKVVLKNMKNGEKETISESEVAARINELYSNYNK